jgi:hypothetical protein
MPRGRSEADPRYVAARRVLLDALEALALRAAGDEPA